MKHNSSRHGEIHLGTHGEDYGNWMPLSVLGMAAGAFALMAALAIFFFTAFYWPPTGAIFAVTAAVMLALLLWITWIRRQYAFGGGGMMEQLAAGKAAAVFVKDLSRLGRNYIEVGQLTEEFFPEHDIRLVAVSDNINTAEGENELAPIRNLFNDNLE